MNCTIEWASQITGGGWRVRDIRRHYVDCVWCTREGLEIIWMRFEIPMDESLVLAETMALFYHTIAIASRLDVESTPAL